MKSDSNFVLFLLLSIIYTGKHLLLDSINMLSNYLIQTFFFLNHKTNLRCSGQQGLVGVCSSSPLHLQGHSREIISDFGLLQCRLSDKTAPCTPLLNQPWSLYDLYSSVLIHYGCSAAAESHSHSESDNLSPTCFFDEHLVQLPSLRALTLMSDSSLSVPQHHLLAKIKTSSNQVQ